jgi:hypothetical protein
MNTEITREVTEFAHQQVAVVERAGSLVVASKEQADAANDILNLLRGAAKALEEKRVELTKPMLESKRRIDEFFNEQTNRLTECAKGLKFKIGAYVDAERKRAEEEAARVRAVQEAERRKLEEEARRQEQAAAAARAKAEQEAAEARRRAEEAEAARKRAEAEGNAKAAAQAAAEAAKQAELARSKIEAGEQKAAQIETQAAIKRETAAAAPSATPAKVEAPKGFSTRKVYGCEVDNFKALVEAVAAGKHPLNFLQPNDTALRQFAAASKEGFEVAGCRLTSRNV